MYDCLIIKNIQIIKKLINEYFYLQKGELIANYLELIYIHKLKDKNIYISKRALKHFVESRKGELIDKHNNIYILKRLYIIIDNIENVIENYDLYEIVNNRYYFSKNIATIDISKIRIVLELINNHYEIVTMHFQKLKTPTNK